MASVDTQIATALGRRRLEKCCAEQYRGFSWQWHTRTTLTLCAEEQSPT